VLSHTDLLLRKILVQIVLQHIIADSVSILELPILVAVLLETVVCQMNIVVAIREFVGVRGCPQVAILIHEYVLPLIKKHPNANVELSSLEEKRSFYVLLNDPAGEFGPSRDKLNDVRELIEDFYASALVRRCWFHQPDVIRAVLHRSPLLGTESLLQLLIPLKEVLSV